MPTVTDHGRSHPRPLRPTSRCRFASTDTHRNQLASRTGQAFVGRPRIRACGTGREPARSQRPTRRKGRPAVISRDAVVEAGVRVGFSDLSIKRVADQLGVGPTALYHHVANLDDLNIAVGEHIMATLAPPQDALSAEDYLLALARSLRDLEHRHPGIGAFCAAAPPEATVTGATIARTADGLAAFGLAATDASIITAITANLAFSFAATERVEPSQASSQDSVELFDWVIQQTTTALIADRGNAPWNRRADRTDEPR